jgi:glycosyltransferase involved in cell wall biosynthesis
MFAGRCDGVIANSASVAADFKSTLKSRMPVHEVWNAVDLTEFSPEGPRLDLDVASGLPPAENNVIRIGLVGTLAKWKGHDIFLRALRMLPHDSRVRAYIVGDALYQTSASQWSLDQLKQQAAELGLANQVGFTGFVLHPAQAMRSLDVVVHASTQPEPFGLVIAEAMACRRALIASAAGGANEIIRDGVNALAHTPGDAKALAALIGRLTDDPELREQLGRAGRQTAEQCFDRARLGHQLGAIYQSVLAAHAAQAA